MTETGRESQETGSEGIRALWRTAEELNVEFPGAEWVPWRAIVLREELLPRSELSREAIEQYALVFDDLPPLRVQRDTFVLIGGRHRLEAAILANRDHVRIVEEDCPDAELWLRAFDDNRTHGVPMRPSERVRAARRLMAERPTLSNEQIARWTGIDRRTVWSWRQSGVGNNSQGPGQVGPQVAVTSDQGRASVGEGARPPAGGARGFVRPFFLPAQRPREIARQTPAEEVEGQIAAAHTAISWLTEYVDELRLIGSSTTEATHV